MHRSEFCPNHIFVKKRNAVSLDSNRLFASLAADKSSVVPYDRDIADNRRKYGDGMLRKAEEHLANQRQFEHETQSRLEAARQRRQEDQERREALEVSCC